MLKRLIPWLLLAALLIPAIALARSAINRHNETTNTRPAQAASLSAPDDSRVNTVQEPRPYSREEIIALIEYYAAGYGLSPATPLQIAICESGLRADAKNPTSSASGVYQYLRRTWANTPAGREGRSVFDADANIHMAIAHMAHSGTAAWNASKSCWNP